MYFEACDAFGASCGVQSWVSYMVSGLVSCRHCMLRLGAMPAELGPSLAKVWLTRGSCAGLLW